MNSYYWEQIKKAYENIEKYLPEYSGNPCGNCRICCTYIVSQGVTLLELDYIDEYLKNEKISDEKLKEFQEYINKAEENREIKYKVCPFYSSELKGCRIYSARPLSCRTFGYFIKSEKLHFIPDECLLKKNIKTYEDETFNEIMPFIRPFYTLVFQYEAQKA